MDAPEFSLPTPRTTFFTASKVRQLKSADWIVALVHLKYNQVVLSENTYGGRVNSEGIGPKVPFLPGLKPAERFSWWTFWSRRAEVRHRILTIAKTRRFTSFRAL